MEPAGPTRSNDTSSPNKCAPRRKLHKLLPLHSSWLRKRIQTHANPSICWLETWELPKHNNNAQQNNIKNIFWGALTAGPNGTWVL